MKHILSLILALALNATVVMASDEEKSKPPLSDKRLTKMQEQLELSDEQLAEMKDIRDAGGNRKDLRAVLTEDQRATMKEQKEKRKDNKPKKEEDGASSSSD
jgi:Spy/CpxP family protein refolding chaperone